MHVQPWRRSWLRCLCLLPVAVHILFQPQLPASRALQLSLENRGEQAQQSAEKISHARRGLERTRASNQSVLAPSEPAPSRLILLAACLQEQQVHQQTSAGFLGLHSRYQPLKQALADAQAQLAALQSARRCAALHSCSISPCQSLA